MSSTFGNLRRRSHDFGKVLGPIMKEAGIPEVEPKIFPLVRFIKD